MSDCCKPGMSPLWWRFFASQDHWIILLTKLAFRWSVPVCLWKQTISGFRGRQWQRLKLCTNRQVGFSPHRAKFLWRPLPGLDFWQVRNRMVQLLSSSNLLRRLPIVHARVVIEHVVTYATVVPTYCVGLCALNFFTIGVGPSPAQRSSDCRFRSCCYLAENLRSYCELKSVSLTKHFVPLRFSKYDLFRTSTVLPTIMATKVQWPRGLWSKLWC